MMEWIKKYNIGTKFLAFLGAATLWFFVASSSDENRTMTFTNIEVELIGLDVLQSKGYVILEGAQQKATVTLTGPFKKLSAVNPDFDIKAFVDVSALAPGPRTVRLNANIEMEDSGLTISERKPQFYPLTIDRIVDKAVPVELELVGDPAGNHRISSKDLLPTMITLNGPETYLLDIDCARAVYDITGISDSDTVNLAFELVTEDGSPVEQAKLSWIKADVASVELSLGVRRDSMVNLRVTFTGMPDYLNEDSIDHFIDPGSISVSGEPSAVDGLNYIDLGEINIKNVIDNDLRSIEKTITLPNGISSQMNGKTATIYITFPGYERNAVSFTASALPVLDRVEYPEQEIELQLFGMAQDIALARAEEFILAPVLNIDELEPGEHTVPLSVTCEADGVTVLGKYTVNVVVLEPPEPDETEPPEGEPE